MNSIIKSKEKNNIEEMIYEVRGKQVMLDSDLAKLYHCGASFKDLGKKCFEITKIEESDILILLLKKISEF